MARNGRNRVVYFNEGLYKRADEVCKKEGKSMSAVVMMALAYWLENQAKQEQ